MDEQEKQLRKNIADKLRIYRAKKSTQANRMDTGTISRKSKFNSSLYL